jgi:aspartate/methionine/tyrosine aminotransferase
MFSRRLPPHTATNELTRALAALEAGGTAIADLTESNPTRVGLAYPDRLLAALSSPDALRYEPHPLGLPRARAAVAADQQRRGVVVDPDHIVLTASTSDAYSWLFKLLCNPGERVLVPRPSYPLFEHLTRLEGIRAEPYDLEYHGRWEIDARQLRAAPADVKAVLVVSPNNPTGSYVTRAELDELTTVSHERGWAVVADEVFADYPLDAASPLTDIAADAGVLSFTLAGLSKSVGLPQVKLGWIVVGGPPADRDAALTSLELIADSFLSVSTPVQVAAAELLAAGAQIRGEIQRRTRGNLAALRRMAREFSACDVLRSEGGWSAVIRVPATRGEERLVLDLLAAERILVHPGYFFDFRSEAFVVVSLLPEPDLFADAMARVLRFSNC